MFSLSVYSSETKKTLFFSNNVLHKDHEPPCFYSSFYSSPERSNQTKYCYRALYVKARVQIKLLLTKSKDKDWKCDRLAWKTPSVNPLLSYHPLATVVGFLGSWAMSCAQTVIIWHLDERGVLGMICIALPLSLFHLTDNPRTCRCSVFSQSGTIIWHKNILLYCKKSWNKQVWSLTCS